MNEFLFNILDSFKIITKYLQAHHIFNNSYYDYVKAVVIFVILFIVLKAFQGKILNYLNKLAKKTKTDFDDLIIEIVQNIKPTFYFLISFYFSLKTLTLSPNLVLWARAFFLIVVVYELIIAFQKIISYFIENYLLKLEKKKAEKERKQLEALVKLLKGGISVFLWAIGIIFILQAMGQPVTTLLTSLGIGGMAVALALQNVFKDLFSSVSIYLDKPFQIGDYIVIGDQSGVVEKIGLKTTRIKTLQGGELVVSNQELTTKQIRNFYQMKKRRVSFELNVVYGLKHKTIEKIPSLIEKICKDLPDVTFDRCHFKEFSDYSLVFEIVLHIEKKDYLIYMDSMQKINYSIIKEFEKENIHFAYPTQTIFVNK